MAQVFHEDSCSTTAQTSAESSDCAAAALRAKATSWDGAGIFLDFGLREAQSVFVIREPCSVVFREELKVES